MVLFSVVFSLENKSTFNCNWFSLFFLNSVKVNIFDDGFIIFSFDPFSFSFLFSLFIGLNKSDGINCIIVFEFIFFLFSMKI
jgi:hypothetical protein